MTNREIAAKIAKAMRAAKQHAEMNCMPFTIGNATAVIASVLDGLGFGKSAKAPGKLPDEEWIAMLELEPSLAGVDIRREIGKAQFWAKNNRRVATRKFLVNWLQKADRTLTVEMAGQSSRTIVTIDPYREPPNWRPVAAQLYPGTDYFDLKEWADVSLDYRKAIVNKLCRRADE